MEMEIDELEKVFEEVDQILRKHNFNQIEAASFFSACTISAFKEVNLTEKHLDIFCDELKKRVLDRENKN